MAAVVEHLTHMSAPECLRRDEVEAGLAMLHGWSVRGDALVADYQLRSFRDAVAFTAEIADVADQLDHHPEWRVAYRRVEVSTTTHDAGGLTRLDLLLATQVSAVAAASCGQPAREG